MREGRVVVFSTFFFIDTNTMGRKKGGNRGIGSDVSNNLNIREDGTIWYIDTGKQKVLRNHNTGYLQTWIDGKNHLVHRLVCEKYVPNPENGKQVIHINGIKDDNRVCNLEWNTPTKNTKHSFKTGINESHNLSTRQVDEIKMKSTQLRNILQSLSEEYGVSIDTIYYIGRL